VLLLALPLPLPLPAAVALSLTPLAQPQLAWWRAHSALQTRVSFTGHASWPR
jgi:hypothetical protein